MLDLRLLPEVFILSPFGFGQNRADDLVTFEGDFFSDLRLLITTLFGRILSLVI